MAFTPYVIAGIPADNKTLYHQIRFVVGDPTALVVHERHGKPHRQLIIRDIEMDRAKQHARVDSVNCPADFAPSGGLPGERETATAMSVAEYLRRNDIREVRADRTLPLSYAHEIMQAGIRLVYDPALGTMERRTKTPEEVELLQTAQRDTERVVRRVCEMIAHATPDRSGVLQHDGAALTSERLFTWIDIELLKLGYDNPHLSIIAGGTQGGDCHNRGTGPLMTGQPVIVDIFPKSKKTLYHGDCTRTVVHGEIPPRIQQMHSAVVAAKAASTRIIRAGVTGDAVHRETVRVLGEHGFPSGFPPADAPRDFASCPHGTGHGLGLEVHEPPLMDFKGIELVAGDCVSVEPGLYGPHLGGVRVEDIVIVTSDGVRNLGSLPEALTWK